MCGISVSRAWKSKRIGDKVEFPQGWTTPSMVVLEIHLGAPESLFVLEDATCSRAVPLLRRCFVGVNSRMKRDPPGKRSVSLERCVRISVHPIIEGFRVMADHFAGLSIGFAHPFPRDDFTAT